MTAQCKNDPLYRPKSEIRRRYASEPLRLHSKPMLQANAKDEKRWSQTLSMP